MASGCIWDAPFVAMVRWYLYILPHTFTYCVIMCAMDDLDRRIVASLVQDGRTPYSRIAEENGVATTTVHQRVRRLTERGVITGTRVVVDWEAVGLPVTAMVSKNLPFRPLFWRELRAFPKARPPPHRLWNRSARRHLKNRR